MFPDTITIKITQDDIENGKHCDCYSCPITKALQREFPEAYHTSTSYSRMRIEQRGPEGVQTATYDTPQEAVEFMDAFDHHKPVKPIAFTAERATA